VDKEYDTMLFELLRRRRKELADAANLPAYTVFSDRTLAEMAIHFPQSEKAFAQIHGVGQAKLERYAHEFMPIIQEYCAKKNIEEIRKPASATTDVKQSLNNRTLEVVSLHESGKSIAEIAQIYGVKDRTVIDHLWKAVRAGRELSRTDLLAHSELSPQEQSRVIKAFSRHGLDFLTPIYQDLRESVSYEELHLIRLHLAITGSTAPRRTEP
jgi:ATP-dependent DNA helicase RecQ